MNFKSPNFHVLEGEYGNTTLNPRGHYEVIFLQWLISHVDIPVRAVSLQSAQLCRSFEIIRPAFLLRPRLLVVRRGVDFQLLQVRVDDFFAAICALIIITSASSAPRIKVSYNRSWLWRLDWVPVGFDWSASPCRVGFLLLTMDLDGWVSLKIVGILRQGRWDGTCSIGNVLGLSWR
jgi:hypothetical protein